MEGNQNNSENMELSSKKEDLIKSEEESSGTTTNGDISQNVFSCSPVYEPDEENLISSFDGDNIVQPVKILEEKQTSIQTKRKLSEDNLDHSSKMQKLDMITSELSGATQSLDDEVSEITNAAKLKVDLELPSTSRVRTPIRSSPRRAAKRCNSADSTQIKTPTLNNSRPGSADFTKSRKTPRKIQLGQPKDSVILEEIYISSSQSSSKSKLQESSLEKQNAASEEQNSELNDSQNMCLVLSPTTDENPVTNDNPILPKASYSSDPINVKNRDEIIEPGNLHIPRSEGYNYSDQNSNLSQPKIKDLNKSTDQESTDSVGSMNLDSPDNIPTVESKVISKLSNGNTSTPTEYALAKNSENSESTPDLLKLAVDKRRKGKTESFKTSNSTTPSTISPLQNGHSLPLNTPIVPVFDVHVSHNEDGEFLSLYIVRTDNDIGVDMCREYQRVSKRFTIDPYLGDVSVNTSPSSVTSIGMINLQNRTSFASTVSSTSTSSSNRTSDGNFVVPQPPRKSIFNPSSTVKGYESLMKKLQDIFAHVRESSTEDSNNDKISIGCQASPSIDGTTLSNGNASPDEINKCDKATPKSSLKKSKVRGRRPLAGKTKRAILPTQNEEPEYMHGMNSPEMVPMNGDNDKSMKSPKEEKPLSTIIGTPKSVNKLKQKKRPLSPRPATPVEKVIVKQEYPGYPSDTLVLAKWVDKRYYSGKVLEITEPNKYLIKFDDGQTKTLLDDFIIFGDVQTLPLEGQSVYALIDEDQNYEPGLVLGIEENKSGTVVYRCTTDGDTVVKVTASELYLTEDQARSLKESSRPRSPSGATTPRRRQHRELDLDNIIQGPRSARCREKGNSSARKRLNSPKSPKASTSGLKTKSTPLSRKRLASESSELSESSNSAPGPARIEEVAGVEPELQRTPRKIHGVRAGPLQLKGAAKQNIGKKNSKLTKFENDEDTVSSLGPIPSAESKFFSGLHFLLTCTEPPSKGVAEKCQESRHYSSEEDGETTSSMVGTDTEDLEFSDRPFNKERLKEQIEAAGGVVYSHFDDVPKNKYPVCKLISPRPCLTAKYIQCIAADIKAVSHAWVIMSCIDNRLHDADSYVLPAGWSIIKQSFVNWVPPSGKRNTSFFKDKTILLCGDQDTFIKFWERVCTLAGANTRVVNEEDLNMTGAIALVTEWDCPHEVQNKANQDNISLVSTTWVVQCLIEGKNIAPTSHDKFSFMYTEPE